MSSHVEQTVRDNTETRLFNWERNFMVSNWSQKINMEVGSICDLNCTVLLKYGSVWNHVSFNEHQFLSDKITILRFYDLLLFFLHIFCLLLVNNDGLKTWPRQFVTTWYHSCFDTSSGSGEEDIQVYTHTDAVTDTAIQLELHECK